MELLYYVHVSLKRQKRKTVHSEPHGLIIKQHFKFSEIRIDRTKDNKEIRDVQWCHLSIKLLGSYLNIVRSNTTAYFILENCCWLLFSWRCRYDITRKTII